MTHFLWRRALGCVTSLGLASALLAGQAHAADCRVSTSGLAFGVYQPLTFPGKLTSTDVTSTGTVSVVCTGVTTGGTYSIALGPSAAGTGNRISPRFMANSSGGANMVFNLFLDPAYVIIWGDGAIGVPITGVHPLTLVGSNQSATVYGRIPAGQNSLSVGAFSGTMTMTMTYNP